MTDRALVEQAYRESVALLRRNSLPAGFVASSAKPHYAAIWSRDALLTSLGANLTGEADLLATARRTLETLARLQAPLGAVPNAYWPSRHYWDWGEAGSVDGSALFIIAAHSYYKRSGDRSLIDGIWDALERTATWLRCLDLNNTGLISSPESGDWMDSSLNRSGKVLYVNLLYYWALRCLSALAAELDRAVDAHSEAIKLRINLLFWPTDPAAYDRLLDHVPYPGGAERRFPHPASVAAHRAAIGPRRFYVSHLGYAQVVDKCDVLANLLAILCEVADPLQMAAIFDYLSEVAIHDPYPVRVWPEPEYPQAAGWGMLKPWADRFQGQEWRNPPFSYHNAGVWPFVGGFYVAALARAGRRTAAESMLLRLAEANRLGLAREWEFREWLHGETGEPRGAAFQSWNAGAYLLAYWAARGDRVLL